MAWAARKERIRYEEHDCGGSFGYMYAPHPPESVEEYEDALDHAVRLDEIRPAWRCDSCGQKWLGDDVACGFCGSARDDVDL